MKLPNETGFAVNLRSGEIHKRHADHARDLRRTTRAGAEALLGSRKPKLCKDCFPSPAKPERKPRRAAKPEPVPAGIGGEGEDVDDEGSGEPPED